MEFTLKLYFMGLLALVPVDSSNQEVDVSKDSSAAVWVLAVDGEQPDPSYDDGGYPIDPHFAAFRFRDVYYRPSRPKDTHCADDKNLPLDCEIVLTSGEDFELAFTADSKPTALSVDVTGFEALPSLKEVVEGTRIPPSRWIGKLGDEPVTLRLKVTAGELEPWKWVTNKSNQKIEVDFSPQYDWSSRKVASKMVLTIGGLKETVTLKSGGGDLVLGPDPACTEDCLVELDLLNSPYYEVRNPFAKFKSQSERHFELLWNLVETKPSPPPAPQSKLAPGPTTDLLCPETRP